MKKTITIYHGSPHIIEHPVRGAGNPHNDYGPAFYCTQDIDMAREWSVSEAADGFANEYTFDLSGLKGLNLEDGNYHILNWLAILLDNRIFRISSDIGEEGRKYILENFLPEYRNYDYIRGYRADDSYFSFANLFVNNGLSIDKLGRAMQLGCLGEQIALKSKRAFEKLQFVDAHETSRLEYYPRKKARDEKARSDFRTMREVSGRTVKKNNLSKDDNNIINVTYLMDIMRDEWRNDDVRLQRIIY